MSLTDLDSAVAAALGDRRLLNHPFYRRWERGEVTLSELASYAAQYRYFETYLPEFLRSLIGQLPEGPARELVSSNLADEEGDPVPHVELFERFASGVGATDESPSAATSELLATYRRLLAESPIAALAGFVAYESQASEIAVRKADGLRRHHGLDDGAVSFWNHHAAVDARHASWAMEALERSTVTSVEMIPGVRGAAEAWWAFLDERDALAPVV
jgi:pyrroloquinoline-quinone synthase